MDEGILISPVCATSSKRYFTFNVKSILFVMKILHLDCGLLSFNGFETDT